MKRLRLPMAVVRGPISSRIRVRRSTLIIIVAFVAVGFLWQHFKTHPAALTANPGDVAKALTQIQKSLAPNESIVISRSSIPTAPTTTNPPSTTEPPPTTSTTGPVPTSTSRRSTTSAPSTTAKAAPPITVPGATTTSTPTSTTTGEGG